MITLDVEDAEDGEPLVFEIERESGEYILVPETEEVREELGELTLAPQRTKQARKPATLLSAHLIRIYVLDAARGLALLGISLPDRSQSGRGSAAARRRQGPLATGASVTAKQTRRDDASRAAVNGCSEFYEDSLKTALSARRNGLLSR